METNVETSEVNGYTEEEFLALLALLDVNLKNLYVSARKYRGGETPEERFLILDMYRTAVTSAKGWKRNGR
jgi:hypothetical protein